MLNVVFRKMILQIASGECARWHPQLSGASFFGSDFIGDVLRELDRDLGVDVPWAFAALKLQGLQPSHEIIKSVFSEVLCKISKTRII